MSQLQEYLNKYFNSAFTLDEIKEKFITEFGVNVNTHNGLYQFKYDQLQAKFSRPLTAECRGAILYQSQSGWKYVARPFNKFFNQHEGFCPIFQESDFNLIKNQLAIYEKVDGSCIILYHNPITNNWQASTLGSIPTGNVGDYKFSFSELFFTTIGLSNTQLANFLDTNYTYIFELACNENRIVTKYPQNQVVLLAVRHNEYGTYVDPLDDIVINLLSNGASNLRLPWKKMLYELDINTLDDLRYWVNTKGIEAIEQDGVEYSEGFVVYQGTKPICKCKNLSYINRHHFSGADVRCSINRSIECFFTGTLDDVWGIMPEEAKKTIENIRNYLEQLKNTLNVVISKIENMSFNNQKEYAMFILENVKIKQIHSFMFNYKDIILKKEFDMEKFNFWLTQNWKKWDWKDI